MKAIIMDLDRTLLHTNKTVSECTYIILKKCHGNGIKTMLKAAGIDWNEAVYFESDIEKNLLSATQF